MGRMISDKTKARIKISWSDILVEDKDAGDFYVALTPKVEVRREESHYRRVAEDVLADIKAEAKRKKYKNLKVK